VGSWCPANTRKPETSAFVVIIGSLILGKTKSAPFRPALVRNSGRNWERGRSLLGDWVLAVHVKEPTNIDVQDIFGSLAQKKYRGRMGRVADVNGWTYTLSEIDFLNTLNDGDPHYVTLRRVDGDSRTAVHAELILSLGSTFRTKHVTLGALPHRALRPIRMVRILKSTFRATKSMVQFAFLSEGSLWRIEVFKFERVVFADVFLQSSIDVGIRATEASNNESLPSLVSESIRTRRTITNGSRCNPQGPRERSKRRREASPVVLFDYQPYATVCALTDLRPSEWVSKILWYSGFCG
jgi:hypothetical protein